MAYELGIPCVEGLLRNRYVGRTFIEGRGREEKARKKYAPLAEILSGKRVFLVEDSIVRLTTLRAVLQQMRERGGAREIHVRVTCPPVVGPCFYGIDMSTVSELYAYKFIPHPIGGRLPPELLAKMAADIGADSLFYMPIESVPRCIGLSRDELCMACVDTKYLTPWGHRLYEEAVKVAAGAQPALRTYEAVKG
jgi:amidophosphoribosyltransferase